MHYMPELAGFLASLALVHKKNPAERGAFFHFLMCI
jgi:hypothetical protein